MKTKNDSRPTGFRDFTVQAKFLEISERQARGNSETMIRKFMKKTKKEKTLEPYYGRLAYHKTKGEKRREKKLYGEWQAKKERMKEEKLDKSFFR